MAYYVVLKVDFEEPSRCIIVDFMNAFRDSFVIQNHFLRMLFIFHFIFLVVCTRFILLQRYKNDLQNHLSLSILSTRFVKKVHSERKKPTATGLHENSKLSTKYVKLVI